MKTPFFIYIFLMPFLVFSQVGIGTTKPEPTAILHVESDTKGFIMPRMTTDQVKKIKYPANGLMVYVIDSEKEWFYINGLSFPFFYGRIWLFDGMNWGRITFEII